MSDSLFFEEAVPCEFGGRRVKGRGHPSSLGLAVIQDSALYFADLGVEYTARRIFGSRFYSFKKLCAGHKKLRRMLLEPVLADGYTFDQIESLVQDDSETEVEDFPKIQLDSRKFNKVDYRDVRNLRLRKAFSFLCDIAAIEFYHADYGKVAFLPGAQTPWGFRPYDDLTRSVYESIKTRLPFRGLDSSK